MMSCRVLKRTVEQHFLGLLMAQLGEVKELDLVYKNTPKNQMVRDCFMGLGVPVKRGDFEVWTIPVEEITVARLMQPWISSAERL